MTTMVVTAEMVEKFLEITKKDKKQLKSRCTRKQRKAVKRLKRELPWLFLAWKAGWFDRDDTVNDALRRSLEPYLRHYFWGLPDARRIFPEPALPIT